MNPSIFISYSNQDLSEATRIVNYLEFMGIKLDRERNKARGKETMISADDSKVKIYIIPTNEEIMIAKDTYNLVKDLVK